MTTPRRSLLRTWPTSSRCKGDVPLVFFVGRLWLIGLLLSVKILNCTLFQRVCQDLQVQFEDLWVWYQHIVVARPRAATWRLIGHCWWLRWFPTSLGHKFGAAATANVKFKRFRGNVGKYNKNGQDKVTKVFDTGTEIYWARFFCWRGSWKMS